MLTTVRSKRLLGLSLLSFPLTILSAASATASDVGDVYYQVGGAFLTRDQAVDAMSYPGFRSALERAGDPDAFVSALPDAGSKTVYGVFVGPITSADALDGVCAKKGRWAPKCEVAAFMSAARADTGRPLPGRTINPIVGSAAVNMSGDRRRNVAAWRGSEGGAQARTKPEQLVRPPARADTRRSAPPGPIGADRPLSPSTDDPVVTFVKREYSLAELADLLLEEMLGRSYSVAVTLPETFKVQLQEEMRLSEALSLLRGALNEANADIFQQGELYVIDRLNGDRETSVSLDSQTAVAFRLGNISTDRFISLAEGIVGRGTIAPFPGSDTEVIYRGPGPGTATYARFQTLVDRFGFGKEAIEIVYMRQNNPKDAINSLRAILNLQEADGSVTMSPLANENAVLVSSSSPQLLERVTTFLKELDARASETGLGVFSFYPDSRSAAEVLNIARALAGVGAGASTAASDGAESGSPGPSPGFVERRQRELGDLSEALGLGEGFVTDPPTSAVASSGDGQGQPALARYLSASAIDQARNRIVYYGTLEQFESYRPILASLDAPIEQILVEASVLEVRLNDNLRYGVNYSFADLITDSSLGSLINTPGVVVGDTPGFVLDVGGSDFRAIISALEQETDVRVVSSPTLLVSSGEAGRLSFGQSIPILRAAVQQVDNVGINVGVVANQIEYVDTGVELNIRAENINNRVVRLDLLQSISEVFSPNLGQIDSPVISQRELETSALIEYGETILLGGLVEDTVDETESGVPGLRRIPILGSLFSSTNKETIRTEIILLLRPTLLTTTDQTARTRRLVREQFPNAAREAVEITR